MSGAGNGDPLPTLRARVSDATRNEQTKLLATGVNNIAVAVVVIGSVTPVTAVSFGMPTAPALGSGTAIFAVIWLCAGGTIHWIARRILRSLRP